MSSEGSRRVSSAGKRITTGLPSVHSSINEDEQKVELNSFKQEKMAAGLRAKDKHEYMEAIRQFSLIKPDTTSSLFMCACARLEMKYHVQTKEAIVDLTKCLELAKGNNPPPFSLQIWFKLGQAYHSLGRYEDALREYTEFIQRCKLSGDAGRANLPEAFLSRGMTHQAIYELDGALKDMDEANRLVHESEPFYLCCRAELHAWRMDSNNAEEDLKKASKIMAKSDTKSLIKRATTLKELSDHYEALETLRNALDVSQNPVELSEICFQIGENELALNNQIQALRAFEQAVTLHPFHCGAFHRLGLMQKEKKQYKQALKSLSRAHDLSPENCQIVFDRSEVYELLSLSKESQEDRQYGVQLRRLPSSILEELVDKIRKIRKENSRRKSFEENFQIGKLFDGLLNQKKRLKGRLEHYQQAIESYRTAVELDKKIVFPQARALLVLCHTKMQALPQAHRLHLEFYELLDRSEQIIDRWKRFLVECADRLQSQEAEPFLNENVFSQLSLIETNRRKRNIDERNFIEDREDQKQNQLAFYKRMRVDLSNLLVALTILNLNPERLVSNGEKIPDEIDRIIEVFGTNLNSVSEIEFHLNSTDSISNSGKSSIDYEFIRTKLKILGDLTNTIELVDIAQLVARHICTRYRSQLICLAFDNNENLHLSFVEEKKSDFSCCSKSTDSNNISKNSTIKIGSIDRLVKFPIAFIISSINKKENQRPTTQQNSRKDQLATRLVLLITQSERDVPSKYASQAFSLPIDQKSVNRMLKKTSQKNSDQPEQKFDWDLHEFFRGPGIFYRLNEDRGETFYDNSAPFMRSDIYGYRLGTREEVDDLKLKYRKKKVL